MTVIRVKGFKIYYDRNGKRRCYHRKTGKKIDLEMHPVGSASFFAEVARIGALHPPARETSPTVLGDLMDRWRGSAQWAALSVRTRADYEKVLGYLLAARDKPLSVFDPPTVVRIRDTIGQKHGRRWADYTKSVLSSMFTWGVERGFLKTNPAKGLRSLPKPKDAPEANRPWTDEERARVMANLTGGLRVGVALCMYLGLDPQDAVALRKDALHDGRVLIQRHKTGRAGSGYLVPILPPLAAVLAGAPAHDAPTVVASPRGGEWTPRAFSAAWAEARAAMGYGPGLTLKGLRHTLATIALEAGVETSGIAALLHHRTESMARHYSRRGDKTRLATAAFESVGAEMERRSLSNFSRPSNGGAADESVSA